jgi:hypothetical protein
MVDVREFREKILGLIKDMGYKPLSIKREILGIGIRMYQEYMQRIHEEDRLAWNEVIKNELESEILSVRDTMLYCVRYAKEKLKDKNASADHLEWINTLQGTRINMLKLLVEGPEFLKTAKQVYPPKIEDLQVRESGPEPVPENKEMQASHKYIQRKLARKKKEDV